MPSVVVVFHFRTEDLWLREELLGSASRIEREGNTVWIHFPSQEFDYGVKPTATPDCMAIGSYAEDVRGQRIAAAVRLVQVSVTGHVNPPSGRATADISQEEFDELHAFIGRAADVARLTLRDYLAGARTIGGQYWVGLGASTPAVVWLTALFDLETRNRYPVGFGDPPQPVIIYPAQQAISARMNSVLTAGASRGDSPALADELLADARFLALKNDPPLLREAVLFAAIACEVDIRSVLTQVCPSDARPVLDFALANPRDVSVQAVSLFDKAAEAVTGRSLRDEDRPLWKRLERLFRDRNDVAHRGVVVSEETARADVTTAAEALAWTRTLRVKRDPLPADGPAGETHSYTGRSDSLQVLGPDDGNVEFPAYVI